MWEVKTVDPYGADGIIEVCLGEWYNNPIEEAGKAETEKNKPIKPEYTEDIMYIDGPIEVNPYDIVEYSIKNGRGGSWSLVSTKALIIKSTTESATVEIISGKQGNFLLSYEIDDKEKTALSVDIKPF